MATTHTGPAAPATERPAHRDGNVLRWLGGYTTSTAGDALYFLALAWAAAREGSATQAGLVLAVAAVPRALFMLGGGVIADRYGPRRIVIASDAVRCLVVLGVAALLLLATPGIWLLVALALVFGVVDALFLPAVGALPPRITTPGQLARVQGMRGIAARIALITGPPLGGLLLALGGSAAAFGAAGVLFAVSLLLLLAVRVRPGPVRDGGEGRTAWRQLGDGLRYIRRHPVLAPLVAATAVAELGFAGPGNIGLVLLVQERGWSAAAFGWIIAGFGGGAAAASLLIAVRGRIPRAGAVQAWAWLLGGCALTGVALAPTVPLAVAASAAVGLVLGLVGALVGALLQTSCDPAYLGRVTSVYTLCALGLSPLTYPVVGAAIGAWGTTPVFAAGSALCAVGGLAGLLFAPLRRAELPR
ncbi:MFS transporter [Streptomyces apocyni]|uniref:MFS transporter n=1 Tax=Streptomyces apocyni TaxID=2654677 RepID=UPI0012E9C5A8|nr:MFS transporter [Streptomyces apocyni]